MRLKTLRILVLALLLGSLGAESYAQNINNRSPYSRYGYGTLEGGYSAGSRAMGGLSVGLRDGMISNPSNPASYTAVDSMTFIFDLGLTAKYSELKEGADRDGRYLGGLDYFNILYRLNRRMAMSAGISPLSSVGYSFGRSVPVSGEATTETYVRSYSGSGSYNNLYLGVAGQLWQGLHLGVNGAFVFGHTTQTRLVTQPNPGALNSTHQENLHLRAFRLTLGAQYELKLDTTGGRTLVIGATVTPKYRYNSERTIMRQDFSSQGASETIQNDTITNGDYTSPMLLGFGLTYRLANHFMVGADLRYNLWSKANFTDLEAQFQDQYRLALGGEWTPNYRARSPWKRATYRAGLSFGNSYLAVPTGTNGAFSGHREYGASLGFALPLVDRRSAFNLSVDYKYLQPQQSGMVKEQYVGLTVGVLFNEGWFRKARVN